MALKTRLTNKKAVEIEILKGKNGETIGILKTNQVPSGLLM